jgi:hypothetical protein
MPRLRMSGAIPPLSYASSGHGTWSSIGYFMAFDLVEHRDNFTITLNHIGAFS